MGLKLCVFSQVYAEFWFIYKMAQRRMTSMRVVGSDDFLDMPPSTQNLYFHLGMYADDDGFVTPRKVMRLVTATQDDLKVLIGKKFVIPFESGVIVITHWKENNYIQKDRYTETIYKYEKEKLACIHNVYILDTQVRLELGKSKDRDILPPKTADCVFSLEKERKVLKESPKRELNIIGKFIFRKNLEVKTKAQLKQVISRHIRSAKNLSVFDDTQIKKAVGIAETEVGRKWTLETLLKICTRE